VKICPFGGFKKTVGEFRVENCPFEGFQKDSLRVSGVDLYFWKGSKRQFESFGVKNCPFQESLLYPIGGGKLLNSEDMYTYG
jgi:hypothetical protein